MRPYAALAEDNARWRAKAINDWIARSGPRYSKLVVQIVAHLEEGTNVRLPNYGGALFDARTHVLSLTSSDVAYGSWYAMREAAVGAKIEVMIRVDRMSL